ncbi:MAG: hypothetical protein U9M98_03700 [Patescibacteria group bacterium]|nr:hypothetical protein [Patescibacteria group bacterium]
MCYHYPVVDFRQVKNSLKKKILELPPIVPLALVPIVLIAALYFRFRGDIVAARVNGEAISRLALIRELERSYGQQALDNLVTRKLVEQAAEEEDISLNSVDVSLELAEIEKTAEQQGQDLDQVLGQQGFNREDLIKELRFQKVIEELASSDVSVSQDEVDQYWQENQSLFGEDAEKVEVEPQIREMIKNQKANEQIQQWLSGLRNEANIKYFLDF